MPDPKLEGYGVALRMLMHAKWYLEQQHRSGLVVDIDQFVGEGLILGHAMIDVADEIAALMRGERDAG
jgi:hypothetical protein